MRINNLLLILAVCFVLIGETAPAYAASAHRSAARQRIVSFTVLDADTGKPLSGLRRVRDSAELEMNSLPAGGVVIRANAEGAKIRSVRLSFNGHRIVDNNYPFYARTGRHRLVWRPSSGDARVRAVPYAQKGARGISGKALDITFRVNTKTPSNPGSNTSQEVATQQNGTQTQAGNNNGNQKGSLPQPTPIPPTTTPPTDNTAIPALAEWEASMTKFGRMLCNASTIKSLGLWEGNVWYYDGIRVYYQIADYTGDASWKSCAQLVRDIYRPYVLNSQGKVGGWRVFPHGLAQDFLRTGDENSKKAALLLATSSPFATNAGGASFELSRETAYIINAYLTAEELGAGRNPHLAQAVNYALGHLDQWAGSGSATYVKPFMMGLTFEALIRYFERTGDPRIPDAIRSAAEWLWNSGWNSREAGFPYIMCDLSARNDECVNDSGGTAKDLNLLIAPAYAWLYRRTGDVRWRDRGDQIFVGGVKGAWLNNGKQFNQNYRWSFEFVKWRRGQ